MSIQYYTKCDLCGNKIDKSNSEWLHIDNNEHYHVNCLRNIDLLEMLSLCGVFASHFDTRQDQRR